jgi:hypothetical protein
VLIKSTIKVIDASILLVVEDPASFSTLSFLWLAGGASRCRRGRHQPFIITGLFKSESDLILLLAPLELPEAMHECKVLVVLLCLVGFESVVQLLTTQCIRSIIKTMHKINKQDNAQDQ